MTSPFKATKTKSLIAHWDDDFQADDVAICKNTVTGIIVIIALKSVVDVLFLISAILMQPVSGRVTLNLS